MIRRLYRFFKSFRIETEVPIRIIKQDVRFTSWQDAIPYLGKPVIVCLVESPDIKGPLEGIILAMNGDQIIDGLLQIRGQRWKWWNCKPE